MGFRPFIRERERGSLEVMAVPLGEISAGNPHGRSQQPAESQVDRSTLGWERTRGFLGDEIQLPGELLTVIGLSSSSWSDRRFDDGLASQVDIGNSVRVRSG